MSKALQIVTDIVTFATGILLARWLMHLSSPKRDWEEVKSVYRHLRATLDFQLLKLHLPTRLHSLFRLDRIAQMRLKIYFANGGFADDR